MDRQSMTVSDRFWRRLEGALYGVWRLNIMSRFVNRLGLALIFFVASNAWALGLGDIRLQSALNQPLRAEIDLLSATPEELAALTVSLASGDTFDRYGIDRPAYLNGLQFTIVNGGSDGSYVQITSRQPITEPFLTFLVEEYLPRTMLDQQNDELP